MLGKYTIVPWILWARKNTHIGGEEEDLEEDPAMDEAFGGAERAGSRNRTESLSVTIGKCLVHLCLIPIPSIPGWWFQICCIFTPTWGHDPM